jgi:hypothetical protein
MRTMFINDNGLLLLYIKVLVLLFGPVLHHFLFGSVHFYFVLFAPRVV